MEMVLSPHLHDTGRLYAGLKVTLAPLLCCASLHFSNSPEGKETCNPRCLLVISKGMFLHTETIVLTLFSYIRDFSKKAHSCIDAIVFMHVDNRTARHYLYRAVHVTTL